MIKITPEIEALFIRRITTLLENGETVTTTKVRNSRKVKSLIDEFDSEVPTEVDETRTVEKVTQNNPTPVWVLQLVKDSMSDEKCIEKLTNAGYIVIDPNVAVEKDSEQSKGLSEFAVQELRSKLLGIDNE